MTGPPSSEPKTAVASSPPAPEPEPGPGWPSAPEPLPDSSPKPCDFEPQATTTAGDSATHGQRLSKRTARSIAHHQLVAHAHVGIDAPDFEMHTQPSSLPASVVKEQTGFGPGFALSQGIVQTPPFAVPEGHAGGDADDGV
jgi:hypothetical protein